MEKYSIIVASVVIAVGFVLGVSQMSDAPAVGVPGVNLIPSQGLVASITPTTDITLTHADSGVTYFIATGTTATLPSIRDGLHFRFIVSSAFANTNFIIDSAEGDNIDGVLTVTGADVSCAGEDQINFVSTAENKGDYVELWSNGSQWFIGDSIADTVGAITCTDPS